MFQVCTKKITVYRINPLQVQKNWFVILFQVDSTYISKSVKKNLKKFEEENSQVPFKASSWTDLKSAADEPPRKSRKQKLDKWQWKLKTSENPEQTGIYKSSIFSRKKVKQFLYYRRKYGESFEFKFRSYATGPCLDNTLLAIQKRVPWRHLDALITWGWIDFVLILEV